MRAKTTTLALALLLLGSGLVWATTYNTITLDGKLGDFAADEKLPADSTSDSIFGSNNELKNAYVTWDLNSLYLGFEFSVWGAAVMYLVDLNSSTGATSFCPTAGYKGAFPANFICGSGTNADLMIALYAPPNKSSSIKVIVYKLTAKNSTDITSKLFMGPKLTLTTNTTTKVHKGIVELGIKWDTIYGIGGSQVPKCAKIGIAGVLRGQHDSSSLGDAHPDNTLGDKTHNCSTPNSKISTITKWHTVDIDKNCSGVADKNWMPGTNKKSTAKPDAGPDMPPSPDATAKLDKKVSKDKAPVKKDGVVKPDSKVIKPDSKVIKPDSKVAKPDSKVAKPDLKASADKGTGKDKGPGKDKGSAKDISPDYWGEDSGPFTKFNPESDGCACTASGEQAFNLMSMAGLSLLALCLLPGKWRRRRKNRNKM